VQVLFCAETPLSLMSYPSVIRELAQRGHEAVVAIHEEREAAWLDLLFAELSGPRVTIERAVKPAAERWLELAADVRSSLDLLLFLDSRFNDTYRARAWRRAPRLAAALGRTRIARTQLARRVLASGLCVVERAIPTNVEIRRYLDEQRPDVVLFTPYLGLRSIQPDFLRAAQALGLRTAICVKSWDNLSSKAVVRPTPDRLFVWNETQRREAEQLHDIPPNRVVVTGAQCFDEWFTWRPRARDEFLGRAGLDPARPYVLYACSVPWTGQSEVGFVRRWIAGMRAAGGALLDIQVLVRPHPKRAADWAEADMSDLPGVVVFPVDGHAPIDRSSKADFYDSIYHSAAVVALNTSVMIEAAIVGRSVLTVLDPEFERVQKGTLHFVYLLEVGGGLLRVARTLDEHAGQLAEALAGTDGAEARAQAFVAQFVRPYGLEVAATTLFVDEIERLAESAAPRAKRTPVPLLPLRPLLAPFATRAARYAAVVDT
jgi:hypothetical protein